MALQFDPDLLHPAIRNDFAILRRTLMDGYQTGKTKTLFHPFEGWRSPQRQKELFNQGRGNPGAVVTNARPWESSHQLGLAVDWVARLPRDPSQTLTEALMHKSALKWDWSEDHDWEFLQSTARKLEWTTINNDRPHTQHRLWDHWRDLVASFLDGHAPFTDIAPF